MADLEPATVELELKPGAWFPMGKHFWQILDIDEAAQTALVLAEKEVCQRAYHSTWTAVTWETCGLRKWLNGEFLETEFTAEEREAIRETDVKNPDNARWNRNTKGGNDTKDKLFLLSLDEVQKYFKSDADRATRRWWWLRSPGGDQSCAAGVFDDGSVRGNGDFVYLGYGIRPAFNINLSSIFFQSFISSNPKSKIQTIRVPEMMIKNGILKRVARNVRKLEVPEGVTEIPEGLFRDMPLEEISLPASLKKIDAEAFSGCSKLKKFRIASHAVSYGMDAFGDSWKPCKDLVYTPEVFRTTGKLCASFAEHLDGADAEALAWVYLYQSGKTWKEVLPKQVNAGNAAEILRAMTELLGGMKKVSKKQAAAVTDFTIRFAPLLTGETVEKLCGILREKKCGEAAEQICAEPAVAALRKTADGAEPSVKETVLPDGTALYGKVCVPVQEGSVIRYGNNDWRILAIEGEQALLISEETVCDKAYHDKYENITWEKSTIRQWLNGEYLGKTFTAEEQEAILETELQNPDNAIYSTKGGNDTWDKLFLLSLDEVQKYFKSDADRAADSWWWLRSPGFYQNYAANVYFDGSVDDYGDYVRDDFVGSVDDDGLVYRGYGGIRPAFHINLNSNIFQSLISVDLEGQRKMKQCDPALRIKAGVVTGANRNLKTIELPAYVKEIGENAFHSCPELCEITWKGKVKIHKEAFSNCPKLRLPPSVYCEAKKLEKNFAPYVPDDVETAVYLLTSQDDVLFWLKAVSAHLSAEHTGEVITRMRERMPGAEDPAALFACGGYAEMYRDSWVDASDYKKGALDTYHRLASADAIAEESDHAAMMVWLTKKIKSSDCWYAPYAVYADEKELAGLLSEMKAWPKEGKAGKERTIRVRGAILLNETNDAMRYADSLGLLGRYAELRGLDEDTLRDTRMDELGLDEDGRRSWTLAGKARAAST